MRFSQMKLHAYWGRNSYSHLNTVETDDPVRLFLHAFPVGLRQNPLHFDSSYHLKRLVMKRFPTCMLRR